MFRYRDIRLPAEDVQHAGAKFIEFEVDLGWLGAVEGVDGGHGGVEVGVGAAVDGDVGPVVGVVGA